MSGACDNFILEDQSCEWFELVQYVESFDMGINFLEGPPGPPGPAGEAIFIPSVSEDGWISWTNTAGLPNPDPVYIKGPPGGGSGDYDDLTDKPSINGVTLSGNKTTADLLIRFSAADVGLGNVANERQYSAQNPPPYPVTSVSGKTGAVDLLPSDVGLGNVANERQYSSQNPPPYPVTSVDGKAGAVSVLPIGGTSGQVLKKASATDYDVEWDDESGGGSSDYADLTNKPSINGVTLSGNKTTAELLISFSAADVGLGNVANERQYSAQNPPPYPVTSVNGMTGDVDTNAVTTYTPVVSKTSGNSSYYSGTAAKSGNICSLSLTFQNGSDTAAGGNSFVGSLSDVPLPYGESVGLGYYATHVFGFAVRPDGTFTVRVLANPSGGYWGKSDRHTVQVTYICQ